MVLVLLFCTCSKPKSTNGLKLEVTDLKIYRPRETGAIYLKANFSICNQSNKTIRLCDLSENSSYTTIDLYAQNDTLSFFRKKKAVIIQTGTCDTVEYISPHVGLRGYASIYNYLYESKWFINLRIFNIRTTLCFNDDWDSRFSFNGVINRLASPEYFESGKRVTWRDTAFYKPYVEPPPKLSRN